MEAASASYVDEAVARIVAAAAAEATVANAAAVAAEPEEQTEA